MSNRADRVGHHELESVFVDALAEARTGNPSELGRVWEGFRRAMLLHLQAEELLLIPDYAREHPDDAAALRLDHAFFRTCLDDFEVNLERRLLDPARVEVFTSRLRVHASSEDRGLYAWALCHEDLADTAKR